MGRPLGPAKGRILLAAQRLFAEHGFDGVSMRAIAAAAHADQALMRYHFTSKEELYRSVWADWYDVPELRQIELQNMIFSPAVPLEEHLKNVIEMFLKPPMMLLKTDSGRSFFEIISRENTDPKAGGRGLIEEFLEPSYRLFRASLQKLMPEMSPDDIELGLRMMIAATGPLVLHHAVAIRQGQEKFSWEKLFSELPKTLDFLTGGILYLYRQHRHDRDDAC